MVHAPIGHGIQGDQNQVETRKIKNKNFEQKETRT